MSRLDLHPGLKPNNNIPGAKISENTELEQKLITLRIELFLHIKNCKTTYL